MRGNLVVPDAGAAPTPIVRTAMNVIDNSGERFQVPSVGLDVPLGVLNVVNGAIQPPDFTSAYLVRNWGVSIRQPASGTVFVVMHSMRGGGVAPGNYLLDVADGRVSVATGAEIDVAGVRYGVTGSARVPKTGLPGDATVWANTPNRLVIITCLQVPAGTETADNVVITATRMP